MEKIDQRVLESAIKAFGVDYNVDKAIEEMAELIKALLKMKHNNGEEKGRLVDVVDEIADVYIMANVLSMMFNPETVQQRIDYKIQRLSEILIEHNEKG